MVTCISSTGFGLCFSHLSLCLIPFCVRCVLLYCGLNRLWQCKILYKIVNNSDLARCFVSPIITIILVAVCKSLSNFLNPNSSLKFDQRREKNPKKCNSYSLLNPAADSTFARLLNSSFLFRFSSLHHSQICRVAPFRCRLLRAQIHPRLFHYHQLVRAGTGNYPQH